MTPDFTYFIRDIVKKKMIKSYVPRITDVTSLGNTVKEGLNTFVG